MRLAAACVVAAALQSGCVPAGFRVGQPPVDVDSYTLRNRLMDVVDRAVTDAVKASAPAGAKVEPIGWTSSGSTGEHEWTTHVRYVHSDGRAEPLPASSYEPVMRAIETALTPEFVGTGFEILATTPTRPARERPGAVGFVIRYARANGAVAGEVVGLVAPSDRYEGRAKVTVVTTEWRTR